jgi:hypothetical protein
VGEGGVVKDWDGIHRADMDRLCDCEVRREKFHAFLEREDGLCGWVE